LDRLGRIDEIINGQSTFGVEIEDICLNKKDNKLNLYFTGIFGKDLHFPGMELFGHNNSTYYLNKYSVEIPEIPDTLEYSDNFLIFPNPTSGFFNIKFKDIQPETITLDIIDVQGKQLFSQKNNCGNVNMVENINISNLQNGLYFLEIRYANKIIVKKIILSR